MKIEVEEGFGGRLVAVRGYGRVNQKERSDSVCEPS